MSERTARTFRLEFADNSQRFPCMGCGDRTDPSHHRLLSRYATVGRFCPRCLMALRVFLTESPVGPMLDQKGDDDESVCPECGGDTVTVVGWSDDAYENIEGPCPVCRPDGRTEPVPPARLGVRSEEEGE